MAGGIFGSGLGGVQPPIFSSSKPWDWETVLPPYVERSKCFEWATQYEPATELKLSSAAQWAYGWKP